MFIVRLQKNPDIKPGRQKYAVNIMNQSKNS